jgi:hypothetical protein
MTERRPQTESELVEFVRAIDVPAPHSLHREVESLIAGRSQLARRGRVTGSSPRGARSLGPARRLAAAGALAAVAAVAVAIASSSGGGASSALSLREASSLTLRPATASAPSESISNRAQLRASVDGVSFPYWGERFGWRATGARTDRVGGRAVTTVFYADTSGRRIGYAIVAGTPAPRSTGGVVAWREQTPYRLLTENGTAVVTWLRHGHLCVVSGRGVSGATLLRLASWSDGGSVAA